MDEIPENKKQHIEHIIIYAVIGVVIVGIVAAIVTTVQNAGNQNTGSSNTVTPAASTSTTTTDDPTTDQINLATIQEQLQAQLDTTESNLAIQVSNAQSSNTIAQDLANAQDAILTADDASNNTIAQQNNSVSSGLAYLQGQIQALVSGQSAYNQVQNTQTVNAAQATGTAITNLFQSVFGKNTTPAQDVVGFSGTQLGDSITSSLLSDAGATVSGSTSTTNTPSTYSAANTFSSVLGSITSAATNLIKA